MDLLSFLKKCLRGVLLPLPLGLQWAGTGAKIARPRRIQGAKYISIGQGSRVLPDGELTCLDDYYGQKLRPRLVIGNDVYIGKNACFVCADSITIEDGCVLSDHVYISDNAHGMFPENGPIMRQPLILKGQVRIGRNTFVGYRVVIMPGVVLGEHCIVGANSVVTHSYPAHSMIAGVPARLLKEYDPSVNDWIDVRLSKRAKTP
ncbi:MAG: acyltransferase [Candidatus Hydrogenedentes bacterium]|nr:acyltransferase [Candidatus Hydrogenedentota bacterium]